jgi:hypothetical protein
MTGTYIKLKKVEEVNDLVKDYWYRIICELVEFILERRRCNVR